MNEVDNALFDKLKNASSLTTMLATYRGEAAIFTQEDIPQGVTGNYVVIAGSQLTLPHDTKTSVGVKHERNIECYTPGSVAESVVNDIAWRVWGLLHRQPLSLEGWRNNILEAAGPIVAPTDKTLRGRIVPVSLTLWHWPY